MSAGGPWIVEEVRGRGKRWVKATGFFPAHNGSARPFYVKVHRTDGALSVRQATTKEDSPAVYGQEVLRLPAPQHLFVGAREGRFATEGFVENTPHAALLVQVKDREYVYIGGYILRFRTPDDITEFHVFTHGGGEVVHAVAFGTRNVYCMAEPASWLPREAVAHCRTAASLLDVLYQKKQGHRVAHPLRVRTLVRRT